MQQREASMPGSGELNALLGRGSEFEGKLAFEGKVRIDGNFTGEISTNDMLVIGDGAKVSAEISCGTVVVEGEVIGNSKATSAVEIHRPAKVHAVAHDREGRGLRRAHEDGQRPELERRLTARRRRLIPSSGP